LVSVELRMTNHLVEAVVWTLVVGAFLIPIMLTVIIITAAAWWSKQWHHKLTSAASPPSR